MQQGGVPAVPHQQQTSTTSDASMVSNNTKPDVADAQYLCWSLIGCLQKLDQPCLHVVNALHGVQTPYCILVISVQYHLG